jgi:tetratricopeptide (TPR) repeat protein
MTALFRPQPIGVLPLPAGGLLLPDVPGAAEVAKAISVGVVPTQWPAGLEFLGLALAEDIRGALALISDSTDRVLRFDAFVLDPSQAAYDALRPDLDAELAVLLDGAAFTAGLLDSAPEPVGLDGELLAVALLNRAADALEHRGSDEVQALLELAVEAAEPVLPALAAQLLGTLAGFAPNGGAEIFARALALLPHGPNAPQTQVRAELLYGRGVALQATADGRGPVLKEAVRCYQQSLVVFRRETHPHVFAEAQTNLALCYLAMPMADAGDKLKLGIAVQALRDALEVWTRETEPERWASVTLNLANALQYLPSTHQEENLAESVGHYEELLAVRDPAHDPLGYARVLANQGNALAHLGITEHAREKLQQAQVLFVGAGDPDSAEAVGSTLIELEAMDLLAKENL